MTEVHAEEQVTCPTCRKLGVGRPLFLEDPTPQTCGVCLERFAHGLGVLSCGHIFCQECIGYLPIAPPTHTADTLADGSLRQSISVPASSVFTMPSPPPQPSPTAPAAPRYSVFGEALGPPPEPPPPPMSPPPSPPSMARGMSVKLSTADGKVSALLPPPRGPSGVLLMQPSKGRSGLVMADPSFTPVVPATLSPRGPPADCSPPAARPPAGPVPRVQGAPLGSCPPPTCFNMLSEAQTVRDSAVGPGAMRSPGEVLHQKSRKGLSWADTERDFSPTKLKHSLSQRALDSELDSTSVRLSAEGHLTVSPTPARPPADPVPRVQGAPLDGFASTLTRQSPPVTPPDKPWKTPFTDPAYAEQRSVRWSTQKPPSRRELARASSGDALKPGSPGATTRSPGKRAEKAYPMGSVGAAVSHEWGGLLLRFSRRGAPSGAGGGNRSTTRDLPAASRHLMRTSFSLLLRLEEALRVWKAATVALGKCLTEQSQQVLLPPWIPTEELLDEAPPPWACPPSMARGMSTRHARNAAGLSATANAERDSATSGSDPAFCAPVWQSVQFWRTFPWVVALAIIVVATFYTLSWGAAVVDDCPEAIATLAMPPRGWACTVLLSLLLSWLCFDPLLVILRNNSAACTRHHQRTGEEGCDATNMLTRDLPSAFTGTNDSPHATTVPRATRY